MSQVLLLVAVTLFASLMLGGSALLLGRALRRRPTVKEIEEHRRERADPSAGAHSESGAPVGVPTKKPESR